MRKCRICLGKHPLTEHRQPLAGDTTSPLGECRHLSVEDLCPETHLLNLRLAEACFLEKASPLECPKDLEDDLNLRDLIESVRDPIKSYKDYLLRKSYTARGLRGDERRALSKMVGSGWDRVRASRLGASRRASRASTYENRRGSRRSDLEARYVRYRSHWKTVRKWEVELTKEEYVHLLTNLFMVSRLSKSPWCGPVSEYLRPVDEGGCSPRKYRMKNKRGGEASMAGKVSIVRRDESLPLSLTNMEVWEGNYVPSGREGMLRKGMRIYPDGYDPS